MTEVLPVVAAFLPLAVFAATCMVIGAVLTVTAQWIVRRWP